MRNFLLTAIGLCLLLPSLAFADVVEPGQISRGFKVINLKDFPDYKFYFLYTSFHYDQGYHSNGGEQTWIEEDSTYYTSSRDASSRIYAVKNDNPELTYESEGHVGGDDIVGDEDIETIVDVVSITGIEGSTVKFKVVKEIVHYSNGKVKEKKAKRSGLNGVLFGAGGSTPTWLYILLPALCLAALAGFFIWRRRQANAVPAHAQAAA